MSLIVNKEVFKFTVEDPLTFIELKGLKSKTWEIACKLNCIIQLEVMQNKKPSSFVAFAFNLHGSDQITFQDLADFEVESDGIDKVTLEEVRQAADEMLSKGFLFRDMDGTLAFVKEDPSHVS